MREKRPLAFGGVLVLGCGFCLVVCLVLGLLVFFSPHHFVLPSPSMMTWALRPHGVRTRGKKFSERWVEGVYKSWPDQKTTRVRQDRHQLGSAIHASLCAFCPECQRNRDEPQEFWYWCLSN